MYYILIASAFFATICSFLAATGPVVDESKRGLSWITKKGWAFIILSAFLAFSPAIINYLQTNDVTARDLKTQKKYDSSVTVIRAEYDSATGVVVDKFQTSQRITDSVLAKLGDSLDLANKRIVKIAKDTSRKNIFIGESPVVELLPGGEIVLIDSSATEYYFNYSFVSNDAGSTVKDLFMTLTIKSTTDSIYIILDHRRIADTGFEMSKGEPHRQKFQIQKFVDFRYVYAWLQGIYVNSQGKEGKTDKLYVLDLVTKQVQLLGGNSRKETIARIEKLH
jgi:hypothetical protein